MNRLTLLGGVLVSTLVVAGCGPLAAPGASTPTQAVTVPAAAAQRGDIQQTVAYSGDVHAKEQITVLPKASGRVKSVLVDIGTPVHVGDVLAELEQDSPEIQVLQAQANLAAAQAKLNTIQAGAKPDDVAADQENLQAQVDALTAQTNAAQTAVTSADAALDNQKGSSAADIQAAQTAYEQAQASLNASQAALAQANNPTQASIAQAQAALA